MSTLHNLFITEKPSVAMEFAKALNISGKRQDGYIEDDTNIVTWCVGHLVTMSYPEVYDESLKKWDLETLPFLPETYKYEVLEATKKQYQVVKKLLNRKDIGCIYYSGDSAREGEYIQRLVRQLAGHNPNAKEKRVWIDSQTREEILRGIKNAKDLTAYDSLSESAYARAIEDYDIGINFSRALTLKYGFAVGNAAGLKRSTIAVGRVMSCVLGMVVRREREIRENVKTVYYTVTGTVQGDVVSNWKPKKGSSYYKEEDLYNMSGFLKKPDTDKFIGVIQPNLTLTDITAQTIRKGAPLLFNLAELQGECTKLFHISPDQTLAVAQSLYEKKLTTYPRTDARVLTTAICKVINQNISGLNAVPEVASFAANIIQNNMWTGIDKTKYTNDAAVSDHYAIIPTGDTSSIGALTQLERDIYILICRRFLSIFYPMAEFNKVNATFETSGEKFTCSAEDLLSPGWLEVADKIPDTTEAHAKIQKLQAMTKGTSYPAVYTVNQAETKPPTRYTTGSMVLAMENAGKLIEDEELREQIKGAGIGTSATRAETIKKLIDNQYIQCDKKQVLSPTLLGEAIYEIIDLSASSLLSPEMTASWEKGLTQIVDGKVTKDLYLDKLHTYVRATTNNMKQSECKADFETRMTKVYPYYKVKVPAIGANAGKPQESEFKCPKCGSPLIRRDAGFYTCSKPREECGYMLWNVWSEKKLTDAQMRALLSGKTTSEIKGFKSKKTGKTYAAKLKLDENGKITIASDWAK